ncbi:helix-turn-helix domain-containing protein [Actinokineospora diospyrosa]|uniref:Transcriptional regulator, XRE family with cupin sensor n=1 Tax=Actinokineospora diospyrosa TaxID=103728 RepID=A0ABT1IFN9_9PSEU|nr:XRE family transcriptional regulator [Actinokineospora diospyrosa]MCP2271442.1 transcriptional regulator, XRE family with cupin sensor [Actinokineospora diospyrosa]
MTDAIDSLLDAVGPRLRALRLHAKATIAQLSASTGISASTLSRLESGRRRPTLELVLRLALAHRVPLEELLGSAPTGDPRVRASARRLRGVSYLPLTRSPAGIQAYKLSFAAGTSTGPDPIAHEGYDWLYVVTGHLRLVIGARDVVLTAGEVAEFDTRVPHWFGNPGPTATEALGLFGPQGERAHVPTRP